MVRIAGRCAYPASDRYLAQKLDSSLQITSEATRFRACRLFIVQIGNGQIAKSVGVYSFPGGILIRVMLICLRRVEWHRTHFIARISPLTPGALLFTILVMFSLKWDLIVGLRLDVIRITSRSLWTPSSCS
jgi:ACR3 family arsenite efflux pump ArsB